MWRLYLVFLVFTPLFVQAQVQGPTWDTSNWNKTRAIKELPFCALILREAHDKLDATHKIYILMEPVEVTEDNLRLLFGILSRRDPESPILRILVETDVTGLAPLATGGFIAGSGRKSEGAKEDPPKQIRQWANYRRTKVGESFGYNPNYPNGVGFKTVILWGKEEL